MGVLKNLQEIRMWPMYYVKLPPKLGFIAMDYVKLPPSKLAKPSWPLDYSKLGLKVMDYKLLREKREIYSIPQSIFS